MRTGIPALTLLNMPADARFVRDLHSARDRLEAVDERGIEATREVLYRMLLEIDRAAAAGTGPLAESPSAD